MYSHDDDRFGGALDATDRSSDDQESSNWDASITSWRDRDQSGGDFAETGTPDSAREASERRGVSAISVGTSINGTLRSQDPLHIDGEFTGEIFASGDVMIAPGATVKARVQAIRMTVAGSFEGSVACTDRFEALETGSIRARIFAPVFVVHDGALINGEFRIRLEDDDSAEGIGVPDDEDHADGR